MNNRVFIGISDTSGFYSQLNKGLQELGVNSFFAELSTNKHDYKINSTDNILTKWCRYFIEKSKNKNPVAFLNIVPHEILKMCVFIWSLLYFDTFILTGCKGFWSTKELALYRIFRKKTIMFCLGSATRLPYTDGTVVKGVYSKKSISIEQLVKETLKQQKKVVRIEKEVDVFVNLPAQAQLCRKPYVSFANIGLPIFVDESGVKFLKRNKVRILHAASYYGCRGTNEFRQIMDKLQKEYDIEYIELISVPHAEVINEIVNSDFVIDEMYSDTPMATFASEAAWFGKPTIVCGYYAQYYKEFYPKDLCPPSLYVLPENAENAIIYLITNTSEREKLGEEAKKFVHTKMTTKLVAERVIKIIEGRIPREWYVDPLKSAYLYGYGVSKEEIKKIVKLIYDKYGSKGLSVSFNQRLEEEIIELIDINIEEDRFNYAQNDKN